MFINYETDNGKMTETQQYEMRKIPTLLELMIYFARRFLYTQREVSVPALPGLMTLLDTALYRANEGCLTATVCAADSVLSTVLEIKRLSKSLLKVILLAEAGVSEISFQKQTKVAHGRGKRSNHHHHHNHNSHTNSDTNAFLARESAESFARTCLEYANSCIEKLTCDRFARSANFDANTFVSTEASRNYTSFLHDNARTKLMKPCDCWESPRLFCPDYIWADEAIQHCLKTLRLLSKHRFLTSSDKHFDYESNQTNQYYNSSSIGTSIEWMWPNLPPDTLPLADQLYHVIRINLPSKLCQFRTAVESETIVSKRLYLVKCEYRAPFRAFLESLQTLMKLPSPFLLRDVMQVYNSTDKTNTNQNTTSTTGPQDPLPIKDNLDLKERLQEATSGLADCLQHNSWLVKALKMEQHLEMLEHSMLQSLAPFTDLARIFDSKKCRIIPYENILEPNKVPALRELLHRLKFILGQENSKSAPRDIPVIDSNYYSTSGSNNNSGIGLIDGVRRIYSIRPILVDIQGIVPREDTVIDPFATTRNPNQRDSNKVMNMALARLSCFLSQIETLISLIQTKGALLFLDRKEHDIPSNLIQKCKKFDSELFEAKFKDWWSIVALQHDHLKAEDLIDDPSKLISQQAVINEIAKDTIRWEMDFTLTASPYKSLLKIKQALERYTQDTLKKYDVMNEIIVNVAKREMNLNINLQKPEALHSRLDYDLTESDSEELIKQHCSHSTLGLELKETSSIGVFGHTLLGAGEKLPIG